MEDSVKVLLVEDDPNDVLLTVRTLQKYFPPSSVAVVGDGGEALDFLFGTGAYGHRAGQGLPGLVLLDLRLPRVSGIQALQWLRADKRTQSVPVAVLTAMRDDRSVVEVHRLGVIDYLLKPLSADSLARVLGKLPAASQLPAAP
jgi:two-component system response regulator